MRMCHRFKSPSSAFPATHHLKGAQRLRIAMICAHSNPLGPLGRRDTGGMSVYIREMSRALASQGHHVHLFVGEPVHGPESEGPDSTRETLQQYFGPNVHWVSVPCATTVPQESLEHIKTADAFYRAILKASGKHGMNAQASASRSGVNLDNLAASSMKKRRPFDVIFSHYWLSGLAGLQTANALQVPHVVMFHTLARSKAAALGLPADGSCRLCAEHFVASQSHAVVAPTYAEKEALHTHYDVAPHRIAVVPCGVNNQLFRPSDRSLARRQLQLPLNAIIYLFVGRLDPIKGLDSLVAAFAGLPRSVPARLVVVGGDASETEPLKAYQEMVYAQGLSERVIFAGRVDQCRLPAFYAAADALVVASHYESFCLVALEALASGRPVIGPPVGVLPKVLRLAEAGVLVQDNSPGELLRGMMVIASDRQNHGSFQEAVRRTISERYSWNRVAQDLAQTLTLITNPEGAFRLAEGTFIHGFHLCSRHCRTSGRP
ncbi:MAG: glycosyltransferase [Desulfosoma sp.]|uniref:glycosyltransferase n=1 Tax=Desulfosoma sp. TaxID=2603217 RepID=UPI00404A1F6F